MAKREYSLSAAEIAHAMRRELPRKVVGDELSRRARQQYLTAMSDRPRPSAPDHRGPEVVALVAKLRVANVQRHPQFV